MNIQGLLVLCTRCGNNEVPKPTSIEVDPVCAPCLTQMRGYQFDEEAQATRIAHRINNTCPGWGEDCGTQLTPGNDLCPDCTMGRMNDQSPRIPQ
jgi:hypothetical protein